MVESIQRAERETPPKPIPDGFQCSDTILGFNGSFDGYIGPFYFRQLAGGCEFGIWIERRHANVRGFVHGGFMTAISDMACGLSTYFHLGATGTAFVTVSMSHQFIGAAPIGSWLRSICKIRKAGRSTVFVDCEHYVGEELIGLAHTVLKTTRAAGEVKTALKPDF
jgi:acyl-coenzyme A thioesterase PaaI-like protein